MAFIVLIVSALALLMTGVGAKPQTDQSNLNFEGCLDIRVLNDYCRSPRCKNFYTKNCFESGNGEPPTCAEVEQCMGQNVEGSEPETDDARNLTSNCTKVLKGYCNTEYCKNFYSRGCYKLLKSNATTCQDFESCLGYTPDSSSGVDWNRGRSKETAEKLSSGHSHGTSSASSTNLISSLIVNLVMLVLAAS